MQGAEYFQTLQAPITQSCLSVATQIVDSKNTLCRMAEQHLAIIKLYTLNITLGEITQCRDPGILFLLQSSILPKKFVKGKVHPADSGLLIITQCHPTVRAGFHALLLL